MALWELPLVDQSRAAMSGRFRRTTVSGIISHTTPPMTRPTADSIIALAKPNESAIVPVINGAVIEMMRPQWKIDMAVERRCGGYSSDIQGAHATDAVIMKPHNAPPI